MCQHHPIADGMAKPDILATKKRTASVLDAQVITNGFDMNTASS